MKNFKFFLPLAALGLLASCSNDKLDGPGLDEYAGQDAYLTISLNVPQTTSSRAATVNNVEGLASEYKVKSGVLVLFSTATDPVCQAIVPLTAWGDGQASEVADIERFQDYALKMEGVEKNDYKGLVILNEQENYLPSLGQTFSAWSNDPINTNNNGKGAIDEDGYITMTNALGWANSATTAAPEVLVDIKSNDFYYKITNQNRPATANKITFYMSRLVAKITLESDVVNGITINQNYDVPGTEDNGKYDVLKLTSWEVDLKNKSTYPVQMMKVESNNSSVEWNNKLAISDWGNLGSGVTARFTTTGASFTRVNWAVDPNYTSFNSTDFSSQSSDGYRNNTHDAVEYANENTFNILNQDKRESTRVLFQGEYKLAGQDNLVSFVEFNGHKYPLTSGQIKTTTPGVNLALSDIISDATTLQAAADALGISTTLPRANFYVDGKVYYSVIIRHFDDTELGFTADNVFRLPFEKGYVEPGKDIEKADDEKYLGRYGVVRNNWYELRLKSASGPGSPIVPEVPGDPTPDDDPDPYYLDCSINILTWAKRGQDVDLK